MAASFILKPLRDAAGSTGGVKDLPWLMSATFLVMLLAVPAFGALVARVPRRVALPAVTILFALQLVAFFALFASGSAPVAVARAFYVWTSVFNLFVVSVFWSFMAELWPRAAARRLFGVIAAGASAGTLVGPLLVTLLEHRLGDGLLLVSAGFLVLSLVAIFQLAPAGREARPLGGSIVTGFIAAFSRPQLARLVLQTLLFTFQSTFLYLAQQAIVTAAFTDRGDRAQLYAWTDLVANSLALLGQLLVFDRLARRPRGLGLALAVVPLLSLAGFGVLAACPTLLVVTLFAIVRKAAHQAVERPGREVLFTGIDPEARYKSKPFIDTVIYRGGDLASGWAFAALGSLAASVVALPLAALGLGLGLWLARAHERSSGRSC